MIHTTVDPLFSMPVYSAGFELDDSIVNSIIDSTIFHRINSNDGYISEDKYLLENPNNKVLKNIVDYHVENFLHNILHINRKYDFYLLNSWMIKHNKGDYAPKHYHNHSLFSGIMYLVCDDDSGDIVFRKSLTGTGFAPSMFEFKIDEYNIFNSDSWTFTPQPKQILIFPSSLEHEVLPSTSNNLRYCVPFNVFVKGEFGEDDGEKIARLSL